MKARIALMVSILLLLIVAGDFGSAAHAAPKLGPNKNGLKAAFVRNGELWIAAGKTEKKVGQGPQVLTPIWSADGRWIAYSKGETDKELWLLNVDKEKAERASAIGGMNFQWSPDGSRIAYLENDRLLWREAGENRPTGSIDDVGNYGWLPDGSGFIASSYPKTTGEGWAPIRIGTVKVESPETLHPLYTIPTATDRDFAIGTGRFKWSSDGRWVAFQAVPTASLSADSNSLCVLSADGKRFLRIGYMVRNEAWFQWAPGEARLAFIAGEGREATANKRLTVAEIPADKSVVYTPAGYADRDFTWEGRARIVVSRVKEKEWASDPAKRPFPFLVRIDLRHRRQTDLTASTSLSGDFWPVVPSAKNSLAWVRSNRADDNSVLLGNRNAQNASVWIEKLDAAPSYYEQFYWGSVLDIYSRRR